MGLAPAGSIELVPASSELSARWESPKESVLVGLSAARLRQLAAAEYETDDFEMHPPGLGAVDARALNVGRAIRDELACGEVAVAECVDAWLTILGAHLLRRYSSLGARARQGGRGGLSRASWCRVEDFIHANLAGTITVEQLARTAGLSPSHFARAFRAMMGCAPHQYVLAMRLEAARQRVLAGPEPLEQVARRCGFSSHSHMTATMQRFWGVSPTTLRRRGY